eukprot:2568150-Amphidinium_carterae.1
MPVDGFLNTVAERAEKARIRHASQSQATASPMPVDSPPMSVGQPVVEHGFADRSLAPQLVPATGCAVASAAAPALAHVGVEHGQSVQYPQTEPAQVQPQVDGAVDQTVQQVYGAAVTQSQVDAQAM